MAPFEYPPLTPDPDPSPLSPTVPLNPPMVGEASPFDHVDAQNRDLILESIRAWVRGPLRSWTRAWQDYLTYWLALVSDWLNLFVTEADAYITEHAISGYSWRTTVTPINPTGTTVVTISVPDPEHRPLAIGDLVSDESADLRYGMIVALIDDTHATVNSLGILRGLAGFGWWKTATAIAHSGTTAVVLAADATRKAQVNDFVVDSTTTAAYGQITVVTDPTHVTVAYQGTLQGPSGGGGGGGVVTIVPGDNITVDDTDPANPIVSAHGAGFGVVETVAAGAGITVDATDPANPIVAAIIPVPTNGLDWVDDGAGLYSLADPGLVTGVYVSGVGGVMTEFDAITDGGAAIHVNPGGVVEITSGPNAGDPSFPTAGLIDIDADGVHVTGMLIPFALDHGPIDPTTVPGAVIYDPTDHALYYSNGTVWVEVTAGGGGGGVDTIVAGSHITVDDTDPANPIVAATGFALEPANDLFYTTDSSHYNLLTASGNYGFQWYHPSAGEVWSTFQSDQGQFVVIIQGPNPWVGSPTAFPAEVDYKYDGAHFKNSAIWLATNTSRSTTTAAGKAGAFIYDSGVLYYSDGSSWIELATGAGGVASVVAGSGISVDDTDPLNPVVSVTGGGGGGTVDTVVPGTGILVDSTDPANPIVSADYSPGGGAPGPDPASGITWEVTSGIYGWQGTGFSQVIFSDDGSFEVDGATGSPGIILRDAGGGSVVQITDAGVAISGPPVLLPHGDISGYAAADYEGSLFYDSATHTLNWSNGTIWAVV